MKILILFMFVGSSFAGVLISEYYLENGNYNTALPANCNGIISAYDKRDGQPIYIGRGYFDHHWIPARIIQFTNAVYVPYAGKEYIVDKFEFLCGKKFKWVPQRDGIVPSNAVIAGQAKDDENLYIGRVIHENEIMTGKIHPSHKSLFIAYHGKEIRYRYYEVLVVDK